MTAQQTRIPTKRYGELVTWVDACGRNKAQVKREQKPQSRMWHPSMRMSVDVERQVPDAYTWTVHSEDGRTGKLPAEMSRNIFL